MRLPYRFKREVIGTVNSTLHIGPVRKSSNNGKSRVETEGPETLDGLSGSEILPEPSFLRMLCLERKRTERSRRPFVLMLLESGGLLKSGADDGTFKQVVDVLSRSTRDTDIKGWYRDASTIGVIFTEIGDTAGRFVASALLNKVTNALAGTLKVEQINEIKLSFHVFPDDWDKGGPGHTADSTLYPDLALQDDRRRASRFVKRLIDIVGSIGALILFSPLFLLISVAVKMTSKGPVLFRGERLGQHGRRFAFLKFRSMHFSTDHKIHQEFVERLISGSDGRQQAADTHGLVYKLTADPRVTRLGRLLRRTSLDELPQFFNVLKGDMSLVGPRPPLPYEYKCYDIWHRERLLAVKPGITGLWQVEGRSRVKFDEMVRMDLTYAKSWSLKLDLQILLNTPRAVLTGGGAY